MITSLNGKVLTSAEDSVVVDIHGMGLRVFVAKALALQARIGETIFLNTRLVVREDSLTLFGFENPEEADLFDLLLGVSGIGPRTALAILSTLSVDAVRRAVLSETPDIFARVPGVGKKTGQKIILYLQGKISGEVLPGTRFLDVDGEVLDALTELGYSVVEAQAALQSIPRDTPKDVETRLRLALQFFAT